MLEYNTVAPYPVSSGSLCVALGDFVATIFSTNDSIFGGDLSEINRDK